MEEQDMYASNLLNIACENIVELMNIPSLSLISQSLPPSSISPSNKEIEEKSIDSIPVDENAKEFEWIVDVVEVGGVKKKKKKKKKKKLLINSECIPLPLINTISSNNKSNSHINEDCNHATNAFPRTHININNCIEKEVNVIIEQNSTDGKSKEDISDNVNEDVCYSNSSSKKMTGEEKEKIDKIANDKRKKLNKNMDVEKKMNLNQIRYDEEGDIIHGFVHSGVEDLKWEEKVGFY
jgi:hypothetical protein